MVVLTNSEKAAEAHRTTLEFLLINHPIDCPVCDQAGECYLQDQYMGHGLYDSKVEIEDKVNKRKVVDLGPIMLDAERCVLCSRCIRFESEVTGTNLLGFVNRGNRTEITTFENQPITHEYAGNLADVCPVGALLSSEFRFKMRVWFLKSHESVCPGCSTGCNVFVDERDGEVQRLRPRRNADVNKSWMCDPGRALYKEIGATTRVTGARVRGAASWDGSAVADALAVVAGNVEGRRRERGLPREPAGHERGPLRVPHAGGGHRGQARLPGWATPRTRSGGASTTCCSAPTAIPTPRAAWTRVSAETEWTPSSRPAAAARCRRSSSRGPSCCAWPRWWTRWRRCPSSR